MSSEANGVSVLALLGEVFLLVLSQFFFLGLNLSALHQEYRKSSKMAESFLLNDLGRRLDTLARLNLELERQKSLAGDLSRVADLSRARYFLVADASGRVLAGSSPAAVLNPPEALKSSEISEFTSGGLSWMFRPIVGHNEKPAGFIFLHLDEDMYAASVAEFVRQYKWPLILTTVMSVILLVLVFKRFQRALFDSGPGGRFRYLVFLAPFLLSQLAFYAIVFEPRQSLFYAQSRGVAEQVGRSLAGDLEYLLSRNVPLEIVPNLPRHLEGLRESLPVIGHLAVIGPDGHLLASAGENPNWAASSPGLRLSLPLSGEAGGVEITLSSHGLRLATLRVMLDSLTMTLVASLLLVELTRLIIIRADRDGGRPWTEKPQVMRPLAFICLFAMDMSFSFIPLRMAEISPVLLGLPESVVLGLPISAEMLMVGLATIGGGFLVGRVAGWRFLFLSGLLMMAVGYVLSGLAGGAAFYIAARAVSGLGYGLLNLGASIFVITRAGQKEKGSGMGELTAGFFAGSLCGCAAGGLMADRLGFAPVFYAATFIFLTVWFLVLIFFPKSPATSPATSEMESSRLSLRTLLGFVGDRQVVNMSLTQVLPIAIVTVGLLNYFLPIYMSRIGAGPAAIGQLNILFSLVIIFAGPRFGRAIDASGRKYAYLILGGLFAALALPSFFLIPALGGIITGIFFLALSSSISENGHPAYLLRLPTAIKLGVGPSISLYTALIRLGQVLGPMAVAAALNFGGQKGLAWLGAVIVVLNIIFGLMARKAET